MRNILNHLGTVLVLFSIFLLIPAVFALVIGDQCSFFFIAFLISIILGLFLRLIAKEMGIISERLFSFSTISLTEGFLLASLSFLMVSMISAIPYFPVFEGNVPGILLDSFFESVSGITTTGLTVIKDVTIIPMSIQLWRSFMQWIGGIGIVYVFLFIVYKIRSETAETGTGSQDMGSSVRLFRSTISGLAEPNVTKIMSRVIIIYALYTFIGITAYFLVGVKLFESINLTFAALSTGGFIITDVFNASWPVVIVTVVLMILGAISFIAHERLFRLQFKEFFMDLEFRYLMGVIALFLLMGMFVAPSFKILLFAITSAVSGTGFSIWNIPLLHPVIILLLMIGMVIGGSTCSTSGGIKQYRLAVLLKTIFWNLKRMASPSSAVIPFKLNKKTPLPEDSILMVQILFFGFIFVIMTGSIVLLFLGYSLLDAFFQVISALCTVGLSTTDIYSMHAVGKIVLAISMLFGRLEIYPLLVLIRQIIKIR